MLEVGDIVLCTVIRIVGTVVFVKIDGNGERFRGRDNHSKQITRARSGIEGSIIMSEIAPGRIRNLREYVVPKKVIVCKILRISPNGHIDLSLRRVTQKEQKEIKEQSKQERSYKSVLKSILKEKAEEIINKILEQDKVFEFLQEAKENPKELEKIVGKENAKKILNILKSQKQKTAIIKKEISLKTTKPDGIKLIKEILGKINNAEIKYLSAGNYIIKTKSDNLKTADNNLKKILEEIEKKSKQKAVEFGVKKKERKP